MDSPSVSRLMVGWLGTNEDWIESCGSADGFLNFFGLVLVVFSIDLGDGVE